MSGTKNGLLDSNILIYRSKGQLDFRAISSEYDKLYVSVITFMEVLGYAFGNPSEQEMLENIFHFL